MLSTTFNVILMILGFGLLIFIHELGHFLAAKWAGIRAEAFAIGMGPVMMAWRKGIGFRFGSTVPEYRRRALASMGADLAHRQQGSITESELTRHADEIGLGETEYSLRWLPIGGFVKMLGQDDADPNAVSDDPRSYTQRPIGKRMVVVAAGVVMNLILAVILYIIAFMVGVQFNAPIIGTVVQGMPASTAQADDGNLVGLKPGDRLVSINGDPSETFADLQIAGAMGKPGTPLRVVIEREGLSNPVQFNITPERNQATGLLGVGVLPAYTATLRTAPAQDIRKYLNSFGLAEHGVEPGMALVAVNDIPVHLYHEIDAAVHAASVQTVRTTWASLDGPESIEVPLSLQPQLSPLPTAATFENPSLGLLGFTPLVGIDSIVEDRNATVLRKGDVVLRVGPVNAPTNAQFRETVREIGSGDLPMTVLRDDAVVEVTASVRKGLVGVNITNALHSPCVGAPINEIMVGEGGNRTTRPTPAAQLNLRGLGAVRITQVNGTRISDWTTLREAFRTAPIDEQTNTADIAVTWQPGMQDVTPVTQTITVARADLDTLQELAWSLPLSPVLFEEKYTLREAGGNPLTAITMGAEETWNMIVLTYLTIDRLIRRSVGVKQIRGPVGIVHLGTQILDKGFMYLIFLLAAISVNLAVINFLPLPIVDGGLFLFLVYEKFRGKPPSIAFQNAAALVGLCLIVTVLLVVTWNDVMRLLS